MQEAGPACWKPPPLHDGIEECGYRDVRAGPHRLIVMQPAAEGRKPIGFLVRNSHEQLIHEIKDLGDEARLTLKMRDRPNAFFNAHFPDARSDIEDYLITGTKRFSLRPHRNTTYFVGMDATCRICLATPLDEPWVQTVVGPGQADRDERGQCLLPLLRALRCRVINAYDLREGRWDTGMAETAWIPDNGGDCRCYDFLAMDQRSLTRMSETPRIINIKDAEFRSDHALIAVGARFDVPMFPDRSTNRPKPIGWQYRDKQQLEYNASEVINDSITDIGTLTTVIAELGARHASRKPTSSRETNEIQQLRRQIRSATPTTARRLAI